MNVEVDHNCHDDMDNRKTAYKAQVVYGDISRFQSDFLLHHFYGKNILGERDRGDSCVIVDEVDSMLLDNGNNMLYLSHSIHGMDLLEPLFVHIQRIIFLSDEKDDGVNAFATTNIKCQVLSDLLGRLPQKDVLKLTDDEKEKGNVSAVWSKLTRAQVIDNEGYLMIDTDAEFESRKEEITELLNEATTTNHAMKILVCLKAVVNRIREIEIPRYLIPFCRQHLTEYIENAKRAFFMKQNESYVVDTDHTVIDNGQAKKVTIIDRNTGVDLASSQWNGGLHQFIQIKHGCRISPLSMKAVFISNVNYLKGYKRINGLSGTLGSYEESKTLVKLYDAELIKIPTFKPKRFSEYVPVIADTEEKWLDALFEQIANQVKAMRSVLVICHSISKVETIQNGLELRYAALTNAEKIPLICYEKENLIVYKREHDKFEVAESDLQPGRLILATNLAGRGTDIKLCCDLRDAGGLHVIVSFLPENSRIEDQAYGRGGRCGDPGSGQIIALTNQTDAAGTPLTVFDLKLFRDNAEIQRLQSLTYNYEYHTQIEEDCLFKFKNCYAKALGQMDSKKSSTNIPTTNINQADDAKDIPTEAEIVYFALLDEWALWLDTQASAIKKCAQDRSDHQRTEIINSIDHFMDQHPIDTIENALKWIKCPQPLLSLGVCRIHQKKITAAQELFQKVIDKFPEFTADACYYLGIIAQRNVRKIKKIAVDAAAIQENIGNVVNESVVNDIVYYGNAAPLVTTVNSVTENLPSAVVDMSDDVLCESNNTKRIETEDYLLQAIQGFNRRKERKLDQYVDFISKLPKVNPSIDPSDGFQQQTAEVSNVCKALSDSAYDMMGHPMSFENFCASESTIEEKFKAQEKFLECIRRKYITEKAINHNIMDNQCEPLKKKYLLSPKKVQKMFKDMITASNRIHAHGRTYLTKHLVRQQCHLPSREEFWSILALSCFSQHQEFYVLNTEGVSGCIEELEGLRVITPPKHSHLRIQLSDFDLDTKKLYDVTDVESAFEYRKWKLEWLIEMKYLVKDASAIVNRHVFDSTEFQSTFGYFTDEDLADWLEVPVTNASWIVDKFLEIGVLRQEVKTVNKKEIRCLFHASNNLECSAVPESLKASMKPFFTDKFIYFYAYNALRNSLDNGSVKKSIVLPWKPYDNLLNDLIEYGFIHDHKLELRGKANLDKEMLKCVEAFEDKSKPRLFIKSGRLISTKKYLKQKNVSAATDVVAQVMHSIRNVGIIDENYNWILWMVIRYVPDFIYGGPSKIFSRFVKDTKHMKGVYNSFLTVTSSFGTYRYYQQLFGSVTSLNREKYNRLLDYHSKCLETAQDNIKESKLTQIVALSFGEKVNNIFKQACILDDSKCNSMELYTTLMSSKLTTEEFMNCMEELLSQPSNWNMFNDIVRDILIRILPILCEKYYEAVNKSRTSHGLDITKAIEACSMVDKDLVIRLTPSEEMTFRSLLVKVIEDTVHMLKETCASADSYNTTNGNRINVNNVRNYQEAVKKFTTKLISMAVNKYEFEVDGKVSKPLNAAFNKYIAAINNTSEALPVEFAKFFEHELVEKMNIESRNRQMVAYQSASFVVKDLQEAVRRKYAVEQSSNILKLVIQYGHAMESTTMNQLVHVLHRVIYLYLPTLNNVTVVLRGKDDKATFSSKNERQNDKNVITFTIDVNQGHFYICQEDSRKVFINAKDTDYIGCCLYETIAKDVPEASDIANQGPDLFREALLNNVTSSN